MTIKAHLSARDVTIRKGTIVDATLIAAPSSTKNKNGKRDPEMHQTKKGNQWLLTEEIIYFFRCFLYHQGGETPSR